MKVLFPLVFLSIIFVCGNAFGEEAFGRPGIRPNWSSAKKVQAITFREDNKRSPLWFTAAHGVLTEIFYPTIDRGQMKDSQLIFVGPQGELLEERKNFEHEVINISPSVIKLVNKHAIGIEVTHTMFTLRNNATLVDKITLKLPSTAWKVYLLVNPQLDNTGWRDYARTGTDGFMVNDRDTYLTVQSSIGFSKMGVGFVGSSDGFQDLSQNGQMNYQFSHASDGNVALTGKLNVTKKSQSFHIAYNFQEKHFRFLDLASTDFDAAERDFERAWEDYLNGLKQPGMLSEAERALYLRSMVMLKSHEDKRTPGALIASLSVPWGEEQYEQDGQKIGGYHLIWPRDLYHVSLAMLLAGDESATFNSLRFLKKIQYGPEDGIWDLDPRQIKKDGAFPQNTWVDGEEYWGGLQLDQVGYPVHLFYQLYKRSDNERRRLLMAEFSTMLRKALDFIVTYGPWSQQERWEENFGISPSSFAVATAALRLGALVFADDNDYSRMLWEVADGWMSRPGDNIDTWTFTETGRYGDGRYYLRVAGCESYGAVWNPDSTGTCHVANSSNRVQPDQFLDQGFLKLALLGLKSASDEKILTSLEKVNKHIRVTTPNGDGWYRYSFDAYGENGKGRLWPLLSGEHGRFAIQRYTDGDLSWNQAQKKANTVLQSYLGFANQGHLLPEQVWESTGEGTGAATPLAWSHAEYIKLIWSRALKVNVGNPFL